MGHPSAHGHLLMGLACSATLTGCPKPGRPLPGLKTASKATIDVDLQAFARRMMSAASSKEPAAKQPILQVQLSPGAWQQALAILATRRQPVYVGNAWKWKPAARRRTDLDHQASRFDLHEYCPNAQQDTHHDSNESVDVNWRSTLPQRQSQRLASAQRHDAIREAAKQAVLATVQADRDSVVQT